METFVTETRQWNRNEVAELLVASNALTDLTRDAARQIVELLTLDHVAAGTILIEEGVTSTGFMALILEGAAIVANSGEDAAGEPVVLGEVGPGAVIGELGILDGKPRSATVTAVTDMDIAVLDRAALGRLIDTLPSVGCSLLSAIMVRISERLRATNLRVQELAAENKRLKEAAA